MANICHYGDIRTDAIGNHFCSSESDFFLDRIDDIESKRKCFFVFSEQSCNFSYHKSTCAIVQGPANKVFFVEDHKLILISDDTADKDTKLFNFSFACTTTIKCNIFHLWCFFFVQWFASVNCGPAKEGFDGSFWGSDIDTFGWCGQMITPSIADDIDKAVVCDIIHISADFITVCFDDDFVFCYGVDDRHCGPINVCPCCIHIFGDIIQSNFLTSIFMACR